MDTPLKGRKRQISLPELMAAIKPPGLDAEAKARIAERNRPYYESQISELNHKLSEYRKII